MDKLLAYFKEDIVIPIASEQVKAAKINTTVIIQKTTCIVVENNLVPCKVVHEPDQLNQ